MVQQTGISQHNYSRTKLPSSLHEGERHSPHDHYIKRADHGELRRGGDRSERNIAAEWIYAATRSCWRPWRSPCGSPLVLPFITDPFAFDVNRVVKRSGLPINLVFRPPPTLRRILTSSRPYENQCGRSNCTICTTDHEVCQLKCVVYKVECLSCHDFYIGETGRPLYKRMEEHIRALRSPQSYPENPLSKHSTLKHAQEVSPQLQVTIVQRNLIDPVERKIREAMEIK